MSGHARGLDTVTTVKLRNGISVSMTAGIQTARAGIVGILRGFMQSGRPFDIATCMYYTGIDPFTKKEVYVAKGLLTGKCSGR